MQLTIEVLPAPLGPMIENSSPSLTPKLTSVSARTPPKRSDTPRTSKACSTHSLRNAYSRNTRHPVAALACALLSRDEPIIPVHRDGSTCFRDLSTSTGERVAGPYGPDFNRLSY